MFPAAVQYMIHAGELIFNECKNGSVCLLFSLLAASLHPSFISLILSLQRNNLACVGTKTTPESHVNLAFYRTGQDLAKTSPLWATRGKLWTGPPGLSRERWDFWRGRFEEAAESEENVAEKTKKTAGTAVRLMAHAEA